MAEFAVTPDRGWQRKAGSDEQIGRLVGRARIAQGAYEAFGQAKVDAIVRDFARYVHDNAPVLARRTVEETGYGVVEDKIAKCRGKSRMIWLSLKGRKSRGIVGEDKAAGLVLMAKPMGVVAAICPVTNPVVTPMCNAMFALKAGNAIVFAPHPAAEGVTAMVVGAFHGILKRHGAPEDLVLMVTEGSIDKTQALMRAADVVVATGGAEMVRSAYSSGKPSFGVGPGNVPVVIDRTADLARACEKIVIGASFDNGIICSHEEFVLVPRDRYRDTIDQFLATGKVWFSDDPEVVERLRRTLFPEGRMNRDAVGKSPQVIGRLAGIEIPEGIRVIVLPAAGPGKADVLAREKMFPVVAILPYDSFDEAIAAARANLLVEGAGHTAAIHSEDEAHIRALGLALPISRLVVNQPSATAAGGAPTNGFAPTTTLGCGSWGGNSISENLDFKHLMNLSRIGKVIKDRVLPAGDEVWAD
ncbi:MAG: aldehyde dehydrogenase family protein [Telmatospirillum sp.]|nr:aldehyde dehydrogenase family protein [Telmatospirillum sp.]